MGFKPNEFLLGLVDFIVILLPGALLTGILLAIDNEYPGWYTATPGVSSPLYTLGIEEKTVTMFWVCYLFVSFSLGYFLNSVASGLDEIAADQIRRQLYPSKKLLREKLNARNNKSKQPVGNPEPAGSEQEEFEKFCNEFTNNGYRRFFHFLFELNFKVEIDQNLDIIYHLKEKALREAETAINAYKWSLTILEASYPVAADHTNRAMAASKFFRSLVVVFILLLLFIAFGLLPKPGSSLTLPISLSILSFREYIVQRQKSIETAYKGLITLYFLPATFGKAGK